ncbi:MAG TPA: EscU/YscU/HrcU family type III secretion system export apparatus switch protein [Bryobacteraceae bacterium]|nr:EscU/YscU/HrcU family type III secretion system export apparatus switch protein [Bryobacteraceae bacterium]
MADQGQRTEKPTKRKLEKSRREGQFPASRELLAAMQFLAFVVLLSAGGAGFLERGRQAMRYFLVAAFRLDLTSRVVLRLYHDVLTRIFGPLLWAGGCLAAVSLAAQLASTRLGFSFQNLAPDLKRLDPLQKLQNIPRQNAASFAEAAVFLPLLALAVYKIESGNLSAFASLAREGVRPALGEVCASFRDFLWKAALLFCAVGLLDFLRVYRHHYQSLRMTKLEVRDEAKETEGNPQTKSRVRRLQRDLARRNMMKEIPNATTVVVNPTHFAVAIRYEMETMAAPRVLAKGKNYLALRIRQIALDHQVPIVENPPLAQALYKSAEVGQEIPPHLYQAVAEVLAYIFKLMHPRKK